MSAIKCQTSIANVTAVSEELVHEAYCNSSCKQVNSGWFSHRCSNARNTSRISTSSRRVIFQGQFALASLETSALADKSSFYKQYQVNRPFQGVRRAIKQIPVSDRTLINNWGCNCGRNFSLTVFTLRWWFLVVSSTSYSSPAKRVWRLARGFELQGLPAHSATAGSHCPFFTAFNYLLPHQPC